METVTFGITAIDADDNLYRPHCSSQVVPTHISVLIQFRNHDAKLLDYII